MPCVEECTNSSVCADSRMKNLFFHLLLPVFPSLCPSTSPSFISNSNSLSPPPLEIRANAILLPEHSLTLISPGDPPATNIQTHINLYRNHLPSFPFSPFPRWDFNLLDQPPPSHCSTSYLAPGRIIWGILGSSCVDAGLHCELWCGCVIAPLRQSRTENKKCIQTSVVLYETSYCDNMETHGCVRKKGFSVQICKEMTRKVSVCVVHPTPGCAQTQQISIRPVLGCRLQGHVGSLYLSFICLPSLRDVLAPFLKLFMVWPQNMQQNRFALPNQCAVWAPQAGACCVFPAHASRLKEAECLPLWLLSCGNACLRNSVSSFTSHLKYWNISLLICRFTIYVLQSILFIMIGWFIWTSFAVQFIKIVQNVSCRIP